MIIDHQHNIEQQRYNNELENKKQVDAILLDFSKAFDKVHHKNLLLKLNHYGINNSLLNWIEDFLIGRTQKVVIEGEESFSKPVMSSVPQGTVLGPLLFLTYINDMPESLSPDSKLKLFADDSLLYRTINNIEDTKILQKDLEALSKWEVDWKMSFHPDKCQVISFGTNRNKILNNYILHNITLQKTDSASYLGVNLDNKFNWKNHISSVNKKANSTLFFLRRHLRACPPKIKEHCYFTYVRPKLEYASSIWDPHHQCDIDLLEKIQRRAARFVTNNHDRQTNCNDLLKDLGWAPLRERRAKSKVTMLFKARNNLLCIPLNHLKENKNRTRAASCGDYAIQASKTTAHLHSFYPSTVRLWNSIPNPIRHSASVQTFKKSISAYTLIQAY